MHYLFPLFIYLSWKEKSFVDFESVGIKYALLVYLELENLKTWNMRCFYKMLWGLRCESLERTIPPALTHALSPNKQHKIKCFEILPHRNGDKQLLIFFVWVEYLSFPLTTYICSVSRSMLIGLHVPIRNHYEEWKILNLYSS